MPILLGLVLLNFFLYPHGPITWLFDRALQLVGQRARRLSSAVRSESAGGSSPMASAARA